jgi:hypothetical protein
MFKPTFPPAAKEYIKIHQDEWPSVLAYKVGVLFKYPCTPQGVKKLIKKINEPVLVSA